ncbi:hypothetical protein DH09_11955 [Bacillaceae bacterium JMAK1]|nr:hypothetical protein DH09_11955 [Bacillaceae bacterium JMAK1]
MPKEDLRVRRTKKLLLESFLELTYTKSKKFSEISVQEICDLAMVHRSTFYKYYTDKYDLFFKEMDPFAGLTFKERKQHILTPFQMISLQESHHIVEKIALLNAKDDYFTDLCTRSLRIILTHDLQELLVYKPLSVPQEIAIEVYSNTIGTLLSYWMKNQKEETPKEMDNYFHSVLNPMYFDMLK